MLLCLMISIPCILLKFRAWLYCYIFPMVDDLNTPIINLKPEYMFSVREVYEIDVIWDVFIWSLFDTRVLHLSRKNTLPVTSWVALHVVAKVKISCHKFSHQQQCKHFVSLKKETVEFYSWYWKLRFEQVFSCIFLKYNRVNYKSLLCCIC